MATLTRLDKTEIKNGYFRPGLGKEHFKGPTNPSMDGPQLLAVLQALEDWFEGGRATVKARMDTAAGKTLTNAQAKVIARSYLQWKIKRGG